MIAVTDLKGTEWRLSPSHRYVVGLTKQQNLVEMWAYVEGLPPIPHFHRIPVPVFTDWWPR